MLRPHTPLFNAASDAPDAGGQGAPAPAVSESPAPQVSESPTKPGVIATATALLRGANANAATVAALRADLTARDATIADLTAQITARDATIASQLAELNTFRTEAANLQAVVTTLEKEKKDVQTEVIHQLAASGLPEGQLPATTSASNATKSVEELWAEAEATHDPVEKGKLAAKARAESEKIQAARAKAHLN
jgi:ABC-type transporter Mla subunit MlaD